MFPLCHRSHRCFLSPAVRHITQTFSSKFLRGDSILRRVSIHQPKRIKRKSKSTFFHRAELFLVLTDGEEVNSFEQQLSDAPDHLRVSVRLPAAQSPGPCPPTGTVLALRSVCRAAHHSKEDELTSGWSAYRGPESLTRSPPAPRSSPKCAVRRGAARRGCPASQGTREAPGRITPG